MKSALAATIAMVLAAAPALAVAADERAPVDVAEPSPEALALAREAVNNGFPPEQRRAMFQRVMDAMLAQIRGVYLQQFSDAGVSQIVDHYIDGVKTDALVALDARIPALFEAIARAYTREFSIDELRQIRDFTATPAGQHFVSRSAALLNDPDFKQANMAYMTAVKRIADAHKPDLVKDISTYFAKHPDVARKIVQQSSPAN